MARRRPARAASAAGRPRAAGDHVRGHGAGLARGRDRGPAASASVGAGRLGRLAVARGARLQRDREAAARQLGVDRAAPTSPARAGPSDAGRESRAGAAGARARRRARAPADAARAAAPALGPRPPGPVDRLRGRRRTGRARRRPGAAPLARARPRRPRRAADARVWLVAGLALCSAMPGLRPRYLACLDPAVAACLGAGVALAVRGRPPRAQVAAAALLCRGARVPLGHGGGRRAPRHAGLGAHGGDAGGARGGAVGLPARAHGRDGGRGRGQRSGQGRAADRS